MLKTVDGKRQLSAVAGPEAINLSFSFRSTAGVQRLSSSAAFGGGRQASTFGSSRTGGYWILAATGLLRPRISEVSTLRADGGDVPRLCVCTGLRRTAVAASVQPVVQPPCQHRSLLEGWNHQFILCLLVWQVFSPSLLSAVCRALHTHV